MQKVLKLFTLIGAASLLLSPVAAFSQPQTKMTQEQAEEMAQLVLGDEIRAGKLTLKQATEYAICAQEDYAENMYKHPDTEKFVKNLERMGEARDMSASEKAKLDAEMKKYGEEFEKLQDQAEVRCSKKLGLTLPRGKVFGRDPK